MIDYLFVFLFLVRALKKYVVDLKITSLIFSGSLLESQKINCVKSSMIFLENLEYIHILRNLGLQKMNLRKEFDDKQIGTINSQLRVVNCVIVSNSKFMFY